MTIAIAYGYYILELNGLYKRTGYEGDDCMRIGIIGGGQLGKMMILAAKKMDFYITTLDPEPLCPSHSVSDRLITAAFDDEAALRELAEASDVVTYEFEHINAAFLLQLEREGRAIYPAPESLIHIQDKLTQKQMLRDAGVPVPPFMEAGSPEALAAAVEILGAPLMLKSRFGGYDGKGNLTVRDTADAYASFGVLPGALMAEQWVNYAMEISVLACRGIDGAIAVYPAGRNTHAESILRQTAAPAPIPDETNKAAMGLAAEVMRIFAGVGMFCVEMFVTEDNRLLVNEVAPRPHNSGHYTIEACVASQFENHIRAIAGLPLGDPSLLRPAVMINILGKEGFNGPARLEGVNEALAVPGVSLHVYGKPESRPRRKMGHLTAIADTPEEALANAGKAGEKLRFVPA